MKHSTPYTGPDSQGDDHWRHDFNLADDLRDAIAECREKLMNIAADFRCDLARESVTESIQDYLSDLESDTAGYMQVDIERAAENRYGQAGEYDIMMRNFDRYGTVRGRDA